MDQKNPRENDMNFNVLIHHSQDIAYLQTIEGVFTHVSPNWKELLGYQLSEVVGQSYTQFIHPDDEARYVAWLNQMLASGEKFEDFEYRFRCAKGNWCWHCTSAIPTKDQNGNIIGFSGIARDITRHKESEMEMKKAKQMLESIFNEIADVVWSLSLPDFKVIFITPSAVQLFERPLEQLQSDSKWWQKTIHPDDRKLIPMTYRLLKEQGHYSFHHRIVTPSGKTKWIHNEGRLVKDSDGQVVRLDGLFFDRTKQFEAEDNLHYEISLQKILINISSTYINIDLEEVGDAIRKSLEEMGYFVGADRAYIFDYDFSDNTTSNTYEWCAPGIQPEIENLQKIPLDFIPQWVSRHSQGEELYVYDVLSLPDEGEGCLRSILEPQGIKSLITFPMISHAELVGFVGFDSVRKHHQYSDKEKKILALFAQMLINIRNRQKWERHIIRQEEKFRNIITNINLGLIEVDSHDKVIFANQGFCEMSGYALDELKGKKIGDLQLYDNYSEVFRNIAHVSNNGIPVSDEICIVNKNGIKKWWFISGTANFNDKGQRTGTIGIHLDITAQKELEQELAKAKNYAEQASKAKELFLANMSHEIRTPLNVIIGMIRLLSKENLTDSQRHYVYQSGQAAQHLLTILNNILDLTKIEAGELTLDLKDFSLSALVANVQSMLYSQTSEKNLQLGLNVPATLAPVLIGDEMRLKQVLLNLLGNAIKFTEKGAVSLTIKIIEATEISQKIEFEVKDSGIGMPEWFISKIFDKFSQEQNSANRKYEGTGLGMAITRDLIQLMGGDITVKSEKGIGTEITFVLDFPIGKSENLLEKSRSHKKGSLAGFHILIAEDNQMNRFIVKQSLLYAGCTVVEACNGKEALQILEKEHVDLILMDIQMPEMDGLAATKYLRETLSLDTPVIALTANAFKHDIDMYLANGFTDFIIKPYDEQFFLSKIINHLILQYHHEDNAESQHDKYSDDQAKPPDESFAVAHYDLSNLKELSRGNNDIVNELLTLFISLARESSEQLKTALESGKTDEIRGLAHKLKPSLGLLKADDLKEKVRRLENHSFNGSPDTNLEHHLNEITEQLLAMADVIEKNDLKYS